MREEGVRAFYTVLTECHEAFICVRYVHSENERTGRVTKDGRETTGIERTQAMWPRIPKAL